MRYSSCRCYHILDDTTFTLGRRLLIGKTLHYTAILRLIKNSNTKTYYISLLITPAIFLCLCKLSLKKSSSSKVSNIALKAQAVGRIGKPAGKLEGKVGQLA